MKKLITSYISRGYISTLKDNTAYTACVIEDYSYSKLDNCKFRNCVIIEIGPYKNITDCTFDNCKFSNEYYHKNIPVKQTLPEGDIIGYKKCEDKVVKLLIPAKAKRINGNSDKCRAEYAKVLEIYDLDGNISKTRKVESSYARYVKSTYVKNRLVRADRFDEKPVVCSNGIHFFRTFDEAKNY